MFGQFIGIFIFTTLSVVGQLLVKTCRIQPDFSIFFVQLDTGKIFTYLHVHILKKAVSGQLRPKSYIHRYYLYYNVTKFPMATVLTIRYFGKTMATGIFLG